MLRIISSPAIIEMHLTLLGIAESQKVRETRGLPSYVPSSYQLFVRLA